MADARSSNSVRKPLYRYLGGDSARTLPVPMFNILNGGKHSDSGLSVQEFKIVPTGIKGYKEQLRAGTEIFHTLKKLLERERLAVGVGDEGGFAPHLESHAQALEMIIGAITEAGYTPGKQVFIGLDVAANSFYDASEDQYVLKPEGVSLSRESLINVYPNIVVGSQRIILILIFIRCQYHYQRCKLDSSAVPQENDFTLP